MHRWRPDGGGPVAGRVLLIPLLCLGLWMAVTAVEPASQTAAQPATIHVAGLVVDYGDGRVAYALVPFEEESLSGFELLDRSGLSLLTIPFGGLGAGVCAIEGTGCDIAACRARLCQTGDPDSAFWQYAQHRDDGGWSTSPLGATSTRVEDGTVDAWAWSSDPPAPAISSLEDVAAHLDVDLADLRSGEITGPVVSPLPGTGDDERSIGPQEIAGGVVLAGIAVAGVVFVRRSRPRQAA